MTIYTRGSKWIENTTGEEYTVLHMSAVGPDKLAGITFRNLAKPESLSVTMTISEFAANYTRKEGN